MQRTPINPLPSAVLALAPNPWQGQWMNRQQILSRLAADGATVLYSTGQWFSWDRRRPEWRAAPAFGGLERADGVWIDRAPRWLVRVPRLPRLDRLSIELEARRLRRLMTRHGHERFTLYVFHPDFQPYVEALRPERLVYHAYDLFELMPDWTPELARREQWLLARADLRIASSEVTAKRLEQTGRMPVRTLPNAADTTTFREAANHPPPADLEVVPRPRITYIGSINNKVDLGLIAELARRRPDWHFLLIGQVSTLDAEGAEALDHCRTLGNVHELGPKSHTQIATYVAHIDVGLIPYRIRPDLWTTASSPLKLYEYLAADRPVVSIDTPATHAFNGVVSLARSPDEWEAAIGDALATGGPGPERRLAVAAENDWSARVATLHGWFTEIAAR